MTFSQRFNKCLVALGVIAIVVGGVMLLSKPEVVVAYKSLDVATRLTTGNSITELVGTAFEYTQRLFGM